MINLSKFAERLEELMFENNLNGKEFAKASGINAACISFYLRGKSMPTLDNLIKIADYFHCSTDFLLGREEENKSLVFKSCPPFHEQIVFLKSYFKCTAYQIYSTTDIGKSSYYEWVDGKFQPTLDNIIRLADHFKCRVDFILGRE